MTQNVSVPEKTLEHWASLCVAYRYQSLAAQWWPVNGVDIDLQALPAQPGKAIQLELKTITPADPGCHKVNVDLGQLWEYSHKPLARQPFYAFPRPHWDGELAAAARADGQDATELAVQRSKTGWWFGDWMVVMTTQQVAGVLRQDLNAHRRQDRGVKRCLVQFDISDPGKPEWGNPASSVPPSEVLDWSQFWSELDECGRDEWPQLIRVPRLVLGRRRKPPHRDEEEELYPRGELVEMFRQSEQLLAELQGRALELETLEPDGNGNFRVAQGYADNIAGPEPRVSSDTAEGAVRRIMGKASSRKKNRRQGSGVSRADLESQRALEQLARAAQKLNGVFEARREHLAAVSRSWWGGAKPEAEEVPDWAEGSAGDRFFGNSRMKQYAVAPRLAAAQIPSAEAFATDSGHWDIAVSALIRAVVLDRVPVTDPLVAKVIRLLGPAVDAEVRYAASGGRGSQPIGGVEGGFPEDDAPVFLLGACCLVDATWAVVGLDPLRDVLDYLGPRLDAALAQLGCTLKPSGKMLAGTLLRAAADFYRLDEDPADAETMRQLGGKSEGNPLDCLISEKAIEPADVLTIGLAVLAMLADLCRTAEASVLLPR